MRVIFLVLSSCIEVPWKLRTYRQETALIFDISTHRRSNYLIWTYPHVCWCLKACSWGDRAASYGPSYAINPFGADAVNSVVDTLIAQDAPNTLIPIGAEIFNHYTDITKQRRVVRLGRCQSSVRPRGLSFCKGRDMTARNTKNRADNSYCLSPESKGDRAIHFRALPYSTASLRISLSSVFRPKASSSCLMLLSASTISEAGTTGSLPPTATREPSNTPSSPGIVGWT